MRTRRRICSSRNADPMIYIRARVIPRQYGEGDGGVACGRATNGRATTGRGPYLSSDRCLLRLACEACREGCREYDRRRRRSRWPTAVRDAMGQAWTGSALVVARAWRARPRGAPTAPSPSPGHLCAAAAVDSQRPRRRRRSIAQPLNRSIGPSVHRSINAMDAGGSVRRASLRAEGRGTDH